MPSRHSAPTKWFPQSKFSAHNQRASEIHLHPHENQSSLVQCFQSEVPGVRISTNLTKAYNVMYVMCCSTFRSAPLRRLSRLSESLWGWWLASHCPASEQNIFHKANYLLTIKEPPKCNAISILVKMNRMFGNNIMFRFLKSRGSEWAKICQYRVVSQTCSTVIEFYKVNYFLTIKLLPTSISVLMKTNRFELRLLTLNLKSHREQNPQ